VGMQSTRLSYPTVCAVPPGKRAGRREWCICGSLRSILCPIRPCWETPSQLFEKPEDLLNRLPTAPFLQQPVRLVQGTLNDLPGLSAKGLLPTNALGSANIGSARAPESINPVRSPSIQDQSP